MNVVEVNDGQSRTKKKKDATDVIDDTHVDETQLTSNNAEYPGMQFEAQMVGDESQNGAAKKKTKKKKKKPTQRADGQDEEGYEPTGPPVENEALLKAKQDEEILRQQQEQMKKQLDKQRRELEEQQKQLDDMKRKEREFREQEE